MVAGLTLIAAAIVAGEARHDLLSVTVLDVFQEVRSTRAPKSRRCASVMSDDNAAITFEKGEASRLGHAREAMGEAAERQAKYGHATPGLMSFDRPHEPDEVLTPRRIGHGQPGQFALGEPADVVVLVGRDVAGVPYPARREERMLQQGWILAGHRKSLCIDHRHSELFDALATGSALGGLAGFDVSPGQVPQVRIIHPVRVAVSE